MIFGVQQGLAQESCHVSLVKLCRQFMLAIAESRRPSSTSRMGVALQI